MSTDPQRTLRQRLVAEIGERGQARIAASHAVAFDVDDARYLACAGFASITTPSEAIARVVREVASEVDVRVDPSLVAPIAPIAPIDFDPAIAPLFFGAMRALAAIRSASSSSVPPPAPRPRP